MKNTGAIKGQNGSDTEQEPFLASNSGGSKAETGSGHQYGSNRWSWLSSRSFLWAHGVLLVLNFGILFLIVFNLRHYAHRPKQDYSVVWSPASDVVEWEARVIDAIPGSTPYTGYPTPESDAAWTDLLRGINLKIFPEEMERLGYRSLALKDGSGYVGSLGVYHELHCVKRVRKMLYRDYYYPNMTTDEWSHRMGHLEHCLELIRQSSVCHGDVNVIPYSWLRDQEHLTASPTMQFGSLHQCVNWDKLDSWAKARRLDLFDSDLLAPAESEEDFQSEKA